MATLSKPAPDIISITGNDPVVRSSLYGRGGLILLLACVCNVLAVARMQYVPGLFAIAGAIYVLQQQRSIRHAAWTGIIFMCGSALLLNYWMVPALLEYTGGHWLIAIGCYLASWLLMAPLFGLQFAVFAAMRGRGGSKLAEGSNALLFAALWVLFEWGRAAMFGAVPSLGYAWGSALAQSALLLQPAAFGGVFALSFLLVFPAYFVALAWQRRRLSAAVPALVLILVQLIGGWALFGASKARAKAAPSIDVALVQPALSIDMTWDAQNGNTLAQRLLALNGQALALKPQLIAWTESTVPWTYRADDDFLKTITKGAAASGTYTLLGMSSDGTGTDSLRSNSIYLLAPDGAPLGRYDKQELLAGAERPFLGGLLLPFHNGTASSYRVGSGAAVASPWGKAGLLLCNEATIPAQAGARAADGATWLAVLGNDAWFADSYIPTSHFYQCRIRAVENRKDLLVNINMADAGVIRASGEIASRFSGKEPVVRSATLQPNSERPNSHLAFNIFILAILVSCNRFFLTRKSKIKID